MPFYVHHGTADPISISSVQRSVEMARKYGADIDFYASQGTGHTPSGKDFTRAFDWLAKLPPKKVSPRYLLESPEGALPTGYPPYLPFAIVPDGAELARIVAANKAKVAKWDVPSGFRCDALVQALADLAQLIDPACDPKAVQGEVRRMAEAVRKKARADAKPLDLLYALNEVFFGSEGFARDGADPSGEKPEGLAVNQVLKSRLGGVLALTGLYAAVAQELKLPVWPVVAPDHAFARFDDGQDQTNVEMTEGGGHFDDEVYAKGYGLSIPSASELRAKGASRLVAGMLGDLAAIARNAGDAARADRLAALALALDRDCYAALMVEAMAAKDAKQAKEALALVGRAVRAWPAYAGPRLVEGDVQAQAGSGKSAVDAYEAGIRAKIKPYGAVAAFDAECYYRMASLYAAACDEAKAANRTAAWVSYHNKSAQALVECLQLNPAHPAARALFAKMGGKFIAR